MGVRLVRRECKYPRLLRPWPYAGERAALRGEGLVEGSTPTAGANVPSWITPSGQRRTPWLSHGQDLRVMGSGRATAQAGVAMTFSFAATTRPKRENVWMQAAP